MDLLLVDARTLAFVSCLGGLIMAMTMTGLYLTGTRRAGVRHWAVGGLLFGMGYLLGFLLLSMRIDIPGWLATGIANNLIGLGQIMVFLGVQRFLGRPVWYWTTLLPVAAFLLLLHPVTRSFPTPFLIDTAILSLASLGAGWLLWQDRKPGLVIVQRATASLLFLMGLFLISRMAYMLTTRSVSGSFDQHVLQILAFLAAMVFGFLLTMGLVLMIFRAKEIRLREVARRDALTGLRNRYALGEISRRELNMSARYNGALSLIAIDLDHFKRINDQHGHAGGDRVLEQLAEHLTEEFRESDLLFRTGGEEFLILLPFTSLDDAMRAAERVRQRLAGSELAGPAGQTIRITASVGVAEVDATREDWDEALLRVDQALYRAKERGRNRVEAAPFSEPGSTEPAQG